LKKVLYFRSCALDKDLGLALGGRIDLDKKKFRIWKATFFGGRLGGAFEGMSFSFISVSEVLSAVLPCPESLVGSALALSSLYTEEEGSILALSLSSSESVS
jgi:hypothetical protein